MTSKSTTRLLVAATIALGLAAFFAASKVAIAQSLMRFHTLGVPALDAYYGGITNYNVARVVAGIYNAQTQCVMIEPPLSAGTLPWVGLDTPPLWDGRQLGWVALYPGGNCGMNFHEAFFKLW